MLLEVVLLIFHLIFRAILHQIKYFTDPIEQIQVDFIDVIHKIYYLNKSIPKYLDIVLNLNSKFNRNFNLFHGIRLFLCIHDLS